MDNQNYLEIIRDYRIETHTDEETKESTQRLQMTSYYKGEYDAVIFRVEATLDDRYPSLYASFIRTSGESVDRLFFFRNSEVAYFVSRILPLFNPIKKVPYEIPFTPSSESSNS